MPAELCIQTIIILHRPEIKLPLEGYDTSADHDPRNACVWILEGSTLGSSQRRFVRFFAEEFKALLADLGAIDLARKERTDRVGAITHASELSHTLSFKGESYFHYESKQKTDFEITFSPLWEERISLPKLGEDIHRFSRDVGPSACRQIHPFGGALCQELKTYIAELLSRDRPRGFELNPVSIIREA